MIASIVEHLEVTYMFAGIRYSTDFESP